MKQVTDRQDCGCYLQATETEVGGWTVSSYRCMTHHFAPESLEALRWLVNLLSGVSKDGGQRIWVGEWEAAIEAGKAAIAKAEGREP